MQAGLRRNDGGGGRVDRIGNDEGIKKRTGSPVTMNTQLRVTGTHLFRPGKPRTARLTVAGPGREDHTRPRALYP